MNPDTVLHVTRRDVALVRRTLLHLTAAHKITCAVVIVLSALIWWFVLQRLLVFGQGIDYSGLHALGAQLQQYNPFFWWAIVALGTLLIIYLLYGFTVRARHRVRRKLVSRTIVERLASDMSPAGLEVLNWAWQDRREPINVGVLQQAYSEMRGDRADKITLARQHAALLEASRPAPAPDEPVAFTVKM